MSKKTIESGFFYQDSKVGQLPDFIQDLLAQQNQYRIAIGNRDEWDAVRKTLEEATHSESSIAIIYSILSIYLGEMVPSLRVKGGTTGMAELAALRALIKVATELLDYVPLKSNVQDEVSDRSA